MDGMAGAATGAFFSEREYEQVSEKRKKERRSCGFCGY
jgi:hypothetical protein